MFEVDVGGLSHTGVGAACFLRRVAVSGGDVTLVFLATRGDPNGLHMRVLVFRLIIGDGFGLERSYVLRGRDRFGLGGRDRFGMGR